jgi:hypothetical protein
MKFSQCLVCFPSLARAEDKKQQMKLASSPATQIRFQAPCSILDGIIAQ